MSEMHQQSKIKNYLLIPYRLHAGADGGGLVAPRLPLVPRTGQPHHGPKGLVLEPRRPS